MKNIDYSQFKKVASDKQTTTLRHKGGHELRIAHGSLSPKMRAELDKLPIHKADGGDVTPTPTPTPKPKAKRPASDDGSEYNYMNDTLPNSYGVQRMADGGGVQPFGQAAAANAADAGGWSNPAASPAPPPPQAGGMVGAPMGAQQNFTGNGGAVGQPNGMTNSGNMMAAQQQQQGAAGASMNMMGATPQAQTGSMMGAAGGNQMSAMNQQSMMAAQPNQMAATQQRMMGTPQGGMTSNQNQMGAQQQAQQGQQQSTQNMMGGMGQGSMQSTGQFNPNQNMQAQQQKQANNFGGGQGIASMARGGKVKRYSGESGDPADQMVEGGTATPEDNAAMEGGDQGDTGAPANATDMDPNSPAPVSGETPFVGPPVDPSSDPSHPPQYTPEQEAKMAPNNNVDVTGQHPSTVNPGAMAGSTIAVDPDLAGKMDAEDQAIAKDMQLGHIQPKTMGDLFAEKSTLGKIGTIFGLMIGGAGAGLSHQPNLLAQMMQSELDRDLTAQTSSNTNAQNWLRLHQANELQKVQIPLMAAQTKLQQALYSKVPSEIAEAEAHVKSLKAQADVSATTATKNSLINAAMKHAMGIADNLPPGSAKDTANNIISTTIAPGAAATTQKNNQDAAGKINAARAMVAPKPDIDSVKMQGLIQQGAMMSANGMAGAGGMLPSDVAEATKEATLTQTTRGIAAMYDTAFKNLNSPRGGDVKGAIADALKALGSGTDDVLKGVAGLNPAIAVPALIVKGLTQTTAETLVKFQQWRAAQIAHLGPLIARGGASGEEVQRQLDGMIPTVYDMDDQDVRDSKYNNTMAFLKNMEQTPTLDRYPGIKSPWPKYEAPLIKDYAIKDTPQSRNKSDAPVKKASGKPVSYRLQNGDLNPAWTPENGY